MKKINSILGGMLFVSLLLTSCGGNSIESDAQKVADLACKAQKLKLIGASGERSIVADSTALAAEAAKLTIEMEKKYSTPEDQVKFSEAYFKALGKCK